MPFRLRRDALALLFFTGLTLVLTWPLIARIGVAYAGNNEDLWVFQWDNWWTRVALQRGLDPLFTPYQFYPQGVSLAAHSLSFTNSLIWIPLAALFGDIAAYNITVLLTFILSGYTMFKLADHLQSPTSTPASRAVQRPTSNLHPPTSNPAPLRAGGDSLQSPSLLVSLISGVMYAFAPYHFSQSLGHVSLASVQWFPLLVLFILKSARESSWRNPIAVGLTTLLLAATRFQFLVLGGAAFGLFVLIDWLACRRAWARGAWARLIAGAALGLGLCLPMIVPAAQLMSQADDLIVDEQDWGQTDLLAYAVPMTYHPIFGSIVQPVYERFVKNQAWMPYLGYAAVGLAVWGAARLRRTAAPWIGMGLFLFVMALGPTLRVNGVVHEDIRLPYGLIGDRFPLNTLRSPDRYNLLLPLVIAALAGAGLAGARRRWPARRGAIVVGAIGALIVFEYLGLPYPTIDPLPASPFYAQMAADAETYAVLDIPLERSDTKRYLYYQTLHGKPIVEGRVARVPPDAYAVFDAIPLLGGWLQSIDAPPLPDLGGQLDRLAAQNARYVIAHKDRLTAQQTTALRDYFTGAPVYEDDWIAVYSTQPRAESAAPIGGGIELANAWLSPPNPDAPITVHVRWAAASTPDRDYAYRLSLIDESGAAIAVTTDRITPDTPTSTWQPGRLFVGDYDLAPAAPLSPGAYRVRLEVLDGDRSVGANDLAHRVVRLPDGLGTRLIGATEEPRMTYGGLIELRAADVSVRGDMLSLWLHWLARQAPGVDTFYFVHVLDEAGNLVAQNDGIHVKFTRPSSTWQAGEIVSDLIEIPLWSLPPGAYRIAVGLTDLDANRLTAIGADGQTLPDNRYLLESRFTLRP